MRWVVDGDINLIIEDGATTADALNAAGRSGWELVAVRGVALTEHDNIDFYYLKRPA